MLNVSVRNLIYKSISSHSIGKNAAITHLYVEKHNFLAGETVPKQSGPPKLR